MLTDEELDAAIIKSTNEALAARRPYRGMKVRHVKGGEDYKVVATALIEATLAPCVVYRSIKTDKHWVRPLDEFCDGRFVGV